MRTLLKLISLYAAFVGLMIVHKPLFMLVEEAYNIADMSHVAEVVWNGLAMDFSVGGYLMIIPMLLSIAGVWIERNRITDIIAKIYFIVVSLLLASIAVGDALLYPYWGFRLDTTPFFYLFSSPSAALASTPYWGWIVAPIAIITICTIIYTIVSRIYFSTIWRSRIILKVGGKVAMSVIYAICAGLLIIPIRGGVTVSTMTLGRSYFSDELRLNHAAINPVFSLLYSATHQNNFGEMYRFFDEQTATELFDEIAPHCDKQSSFSLAVQRPDIYLVILESFSAHLLPSLGGEPIALSLDKLAQESISFTDFYSSSFRTDRGLVAILCGYPAQPTTSLMRYTDKLDNLPSLPRILREKAGYELEYYYGGDINFTNLNALLYSNGFEKIICDKDFPISERLSKWGVHDDILWAKVIEDVRKSDGSDKPHFRVIQTSSSHEPFEVPYNASENPRINSFMFADYHFGKFIDSLKACGKWDNALIAVVADHYGVYPTNISDPAKRHHIPFILAGGAVADTSCVLSNTRSAPATQNDIAATLLGMLALPHDEFRFSRDLFSDDNSKVAFFSEPSWIALKSEDELVVISTDTEQIIGECQNDTLANYAKAYLQTIYSDIDKR